MNIHEFQAKQFFKVYGIPIPEGQAGNTTAAALSIAENLFQAQTGKIVIKAQIHAGGRGKGQLQNYPDIRGVTLVNDLTQAQNLLPKLLGQTLITKQTGPKGQLINHLLLEKACEIAKEFYLALLIDRETSRLTFIASTAGGMDIEEVAKNTPELLIKQSIDPATGFMPYHGRKLAKALQLTGESAKQASTICSKLYKMFTELDASLIEINPLILTPAGELIALDAKITFDDNSLYRHPEIVSLQDPTAEDPKEQAAREAGFSYVALEGQIGCLVNGAGLAMATMDIIKEHHGSPANFLDIGGGATSEQVTKAFKIILQDPAVEAILINIFGGIAKCDVIAKGVVEAVHDVGLKVPLVVRLEGTNVELGKQILKDSGLTLIVAEEMHDAAEKVVNCLKRRT